MLAHFGTASRPRPTSWDCRQYVGRSTTRRRKTRLRECLAPSHRASSPVEASQHVPMPFASQPPKSRRPCAKRSRQGSDSCRNQKRMPARHGNLRRWLGGGSAQIFRRKTGKKEPGSDPGTAECFTTLAWLGSWVGYASSRKRATRSLPRARRFEPAALMTVAGSPLEAPGHCCCERFE